MAVSLNRFAWAALRPPRLAAGLALGAASGAAVGQMPLAIATLFAAITAWAGAATMRCRPVLATQIRLFWARRRAQTIGVVAVEIDEPAIGLNPNPNATNSAIFQRLRSCLLPSEQINLVAPGRFLILLAGARNPNLGAAIQLCRQMQHLAEAPVRHAAGESYPTISVGLCLSDRIGVPTGRSMTSGALSALAEARLRAPSAVRSFSDVMQSRIDSRSRMAMQLNTAFETEEICAFYQPQICAISGRLTGMEALARWVHPERGLISPAEFMPALEKSGMMSRLGAHMIEQSLKTLAQWDAVGLSVPRISVNFSTAELRDPQLVERVAFELDRHGLAGQRLGVEVLETVVANRSDEVICTNLAGLADLGCCVDLDDFGTGHASITNVRRFSIQRIKIDRSFVQGIDHDAEQQNMLAAILTMAERLELETLAEGVETDAERHTLAALGCEHLQGFVIARPMAREDCEAWLARRSAQARPSNKPTVLRAV